LIGILVEDQSEIAGLDISKYTTSAPKKEAAPQQAPTPQK
jgi:hypothetical protein